MVFIHALSRVRRGQLVGEVLDSSLRRSSTPASWMPLIHTRNALRQRLLHDPSSLENTHPPDWASPTALTLLASPIDFDWLADHANKTRLSSRPGPAPASSQPSPPSFVGPQVNGPVSSFFSFSPAFPKAPSASFRQPRSLGLYLFFSE